MECMELDKSSYDSVKTERGCIVESCVGSLVWVRRRNGHWWPGRVLAPHEVPRSHLLAPKSGTPVKLLGKDDATVDWYNFEKSRRIKSFRCGEFDDCIERASSFGCLRSKNREKYARRDDAILHALELEKRQADGMQSSETSLSAAAMLGPPVFSKQLMSNSGLKPNYHGSGRVANLEARRYPLGPAPHASNASDGSTRTRPSTKFDNGVPRMRGLQDFGLQVANLKPIKSSCTNMSERCLIRDDIGNYNKGDDSFNNLHGASPTEGDHNKMESCVTRLTAGVCSTPSVSKTSLSVVPKRKRHPTGSSADESSYKKRDRRRPLTQILKKSSSKASILACESSILPSSTTDCLTRLCCRDGTEATSSQHAFQQVVNACRSSLEQRDPELQPALFHGSCGLKHNQSRLLTKPDTTLTNLCSNNRDTYRFPSSVNAHVDFNVLLRPSFGTSDCQGRKCAPCFPAIAYTGSATSVNTSNANKTETRCSKNSLWYGKDVQEHVVLQSISQWQAKKRRNTRKPPHHLGIEHFEFGAACRNASLQKDESPLNQQMLTPRGHCITKALREKRLNLLVGNNETQGTASKREDKKAGLQKVCFTSRTSKPCWSKDTERQGLLWIDVRVELKDEIRSRNIELVSLFSEAMNSPILGYPVIVLRSRARVSSVCPQAKPETMNQRIGYRALQHPKNKILNKSPPERGPLEKARPKSRGRKPRKSGSMLQKTRMLSSLASTEFVVGKEHHDIGGSHDARYPEVFKAPTVTCIPVHLVFERIREALYRQPVQALKESYEEIVPNRKS